MCFKFVFIFEYGLNFFVVQFKKATVTLDLPPGSWTGFYSSQPVFLYCLFVFQIRASPNQFVCESKFLPQLQYSVTRRSMVDDYIIDTKIALRNYNKTENVRSDFFLLYYCGDAALPGRVSVA